MAKLFYLSIPLAGLNFAGSIKLRYNLVFLMLLFILCSFNFSFILYNYTNVGKLCKKVCIRSTDNFFWLIFNYFKLF
jgi:hypothetical protein